MLNNLKQNSFILGCITFVYLVWKAATVQLTHDEVYTVMQLTPQPVWDLVCYKDSYTNNHILNTLLCKLSCNLFGISAFSGRIPILISFLIYFYFCFQLSKLVFSLKKNAVWYQHAFMSVMICNPYLLDFFSLARGYGMAIACMMGAMYHSTQYVCFNKNNSLPFALIWSTGAVYAQFGLLHFWLGLQAILCVYHLGSVPSQRNKGIVIQLLAVLLTTILIYFPIQAILRDNQIAYYGTKGFLEDTINSVIRNSLFSQAYFHPRTFDVFADLMLGLFALIGINSILQIKNFKFLKISDNWLFSILAMTALSVVLQFHLLGNQYVIDRTALFFYPLLAMNFPFAASAVERIQPKISRLILSILLIFSAYHTIRSSNLRSYREWYYDIHTFEVLDFLSKERSQRAARGDTQLIRLDVSWIFQPSMEFHWRTRQYRSWMSSPPFHGEVQPNSEYEFYYASNDDVPKLSQNYEIVLRFPDNVGQLMRKKQK